MPQKLITAPTPKKGQVWVSNDKRDSNPQYMMIVGFDTNPRGGSGGLPPAGAQYARLAPCGANGVVIPGTRIRRIRVDRLRPTANGYRTVSGPGVDGE